MFRDLSTSTKLLLLCGLFILSLAVTTYSLVTEKQIAIQFARKELIGSQYIAALRPTYEVVLAQQGERGTVALIRTDELIRVLTSGRAGSAVGLETAELEQALVKALRDLPLTMAESANGNDPVQNVLAKARSLIVRAADDSNLTLDPDIDSYYLQTIVTTKLPAWLAQLARMQALFSRSVPSGTSVEEHRVRFQVLEGVLQSLLDDTAEDLKAAFRGNNGDSVKKATEGALYTAIAASRSYLDDLKAGMNDSPADPASDLLDQSFARATSSATAAWTAVQGELDRILRQRIDGLLARLRGGVGATGVLAALSLLVAYLTLRYIVTPLRRLEAVATNVRETKDYRLRVNYDGKDEIGQVAVAFNDMLSELSATREREKAEQTELARTSKLMTIGAMTASIAHEVNQPLAAVVTNSNAALRWLANQEPNLDEARAALKRIIDNGHRASKVIGSIRAMFKKDLAERTRFNVNDLTREVLILAQDSLQAHQVTLRTELREGVPEVLADRVQLQQVLLNLIINGAEAMAGVTDRERLLQVSSAVHDADGVVITVTDSGTGIDPKDINQIFEPFYTTKASGMGMGLAICKSIVESHGGRLWVTPANPCGTAFHVAMPGYMVGEG
ncbi:sensor histidine kinase [Taklimakanibacter deserti]|uniref:sensor histidine kinase n=1 Tax=Taklimakanibacter deserti TaxID=2267839 RepID=UPI0013C4DED4